MPGDSEVVKPLNTPLKAEDCAPTLTRVVVRLRKSRRKTSVIKFVSFGTTLLAGLTNATYRPSGVMTELCDDASGPNEEFFTPFPPFVLTLTSVVVPLTRPRTK